MVSDYGRSCVGLRPTSPAAREKNLWYPGYSIRATAVTILDKCGYEARHIMAVNGHKKESSIRSYCKTDTSTKKQMSESMAAATSTVRFSHNIINYQKNLWYPGYSIRATAVTILDKCGYEARHIMAVNGHKKESSIRSYCKTDTSTKKQMSESMAAATSTVRFSHNIMNYQNLVSVLSAEAHNTDPGFDNS